MNQIGLVSIRHKAFGYDNTMTVRIRYFLSASMELFMSTAVYGFWLDDVLCYLHSEKYFLF